MAIKHPFRTALFVFMGCILLVFLCFASPFIWYEVHIHQLEHHIRSHQNPEELRAWAAGLVVTYSSSNYLEMIPGMVANGLPAGIPVSGRSPRVLVEQDRYFENSHGPYHVTLAWVCNGFMPMWGMDIGDTNFVCSHKNAKMWVPGVYFFLEP